MFFSLSLVCEIKDFIPFSLSHLAFTVHTLLQFHKNTSFLGKFKKLQQIHLSLTKGIVLLNDEISPQDI